MSRKHKVVIGAASDVGRVREVNEDSFHPPPQASLREAVPPGLDALCVVADGMGGYQAGDVASRLAVEAVVGLFFGSTAKVAFGSRQRPHPPGPPLPTDKAPSGEGGVRSGPAPPSPERKSGEGGRGGEVRPAFFERVKPADLGGDKEEWLALLEAAFATANQRVYEQAQKEEGREGMGTTLTVAAVADGALYFGHVGDSRLYLIRGGAIEQLTQDHSWVDEQVRRGELTEEEARNHPQRNIITAAVGRDLELTPDLDSLPLEPGDRLLLCTDGLSGLVTDEELCQAVTNWKHPQPACESLIHLANDRGGEDNITVLIAHFDLAPQSGWRGLFRRR